MKNYTLPLWFCICVLLNACDEPFVAETTQYPDFVVTSTKISNQTVNVIAQDQYGYIWMGTDRGVNKYNGYDFHSFFHNDNPYSICDNQVKSLLIDSGGCVWIGTVNGICHYSKEERFVTLPISGKSKYIYRIFETPKGLIVAYTGNSLEAFDKNADDERFFEVVRFGAEDLYPSVAMDNAGLIWALNGNRLRWYDLDNHTQSDIITLDHFYNGLFVHRGNLWLYSLDGKIALFDTNLQRQVELPSSVKQLKTKLVSGIRSINNYNDYLLFITLSNEIYMDNITVGEVMHSSDPHFPLVIPDSDINTLFTDKDDNLWFGTMDKGFSVQYSYSKQFNSNRYLSNLVGESSVTGLAENSKGQVFISSGRKGILLWDQNTNEVYPLEQPFALPGVYPTRLFVDDQDLLYVNYSGFFVISYTVEGRKLIPIVYPYNKRANFYNASQDKKGRIWMGAFGSNVYILDKNEKNVTEIPIFHGSDSYTFSPEVLPLQDGRMLTASLNVGLTFIDPQTLEKRAISVADKVGPVFIPVAMMEDSYGMVWIGTRGQGIVRFDPRTEEITNYTDIHCCEVMDFVEDRQGMIWISTMDGLMKYDPTVQKYSYYYAFDGTGGDVYNEGAGLLTSRGYLIFGGTHGLTVFNPVTVNSRRKCRLVFEDVSVNNIVQHAYNSPTINRHLSEGKQIRLYQKSDATVGISFVAIDYVENPANHYSYRMKGFEEDWVTSLNNRHAFYSNLPAGAYQFEVRVWNSDYSKILAEDAVEVTVVPIFWLQPYMKWGVYPALSLLILGLFAHFFQRIQKQRKLTAVAIQEKEQEQRINDVNMSYFLNISHEMRTPLSLIKGPIDMLTADAAMSDDNRRLLTIVKRNVGRMLKYLNQLMDINKLENDTLNLEVGYGDVSAVAKNILEIYIVNCKAKQITLSQRGYDEPFIALFSADNLEKIFSNLLSNAVKYTPIGGHIDFNFDVINSSQALAAFSDLQPTPLVDEYMLFTICDTGIGVPEKERENIFKRYYQVAQNGGTYNFGTGIGLYYSQRLIALHHGAVKVDGREDGASGSVFSFVLPLGEKIYENDRRVEEKIVQKMDFPRQMTILETPDKGENEEKQTLLIVEDETEVARFLKLLFHNDYRVVNRFDADSAWEAIEEIEPDVILSDILMPGKMDGYAFCRAVKGNITTSHIPVILLTAKDTVESQVEGLNAGADAYVMKPFDSAYLLALVKSQLANRDRLREMISETTTTEKISNETLSAFDKEFLDAVYDLMEKELSNPELNITKMAEALKIGRTKFYYKVKGLTGDNPNSFFKKYKLNRASQLLSEGSYNISEVADITGFSTLSHFSVSFKKQFGVNPSDYIKGAHKS